jgi:hypothetical protein
MKRILAIFLIMLVTGCATGVAKFPEVPDTLTAPAPALTPLDTSKKIELSDIVENANENAGKYYELRTKYNAWIEWYNTQQKIFDSIK